MLNKVRIFDEGFAKNPITVAKVIPILVDFNQKMEEILFDMRGLFEGLEVGSIGSTTQLDHQHGGATNVARVGSKGCGIDAHSYKIGTTTSFRAS